jgi:hypothetical protein
MSMHTKYAASGADWLLADDPGVTPNPDGLPGLEQVKDIVGAFLVWGLVAAVAAVAIGAGVMAFGKITNRPGYSEGGKTTVVSAAVASIIIGAANATVMFFSGVGEQVDGAQPPPRIRSTISATDTSAPADVGGMWRHR